MSSIVLGTVDKYSIPKRFMLTSRFFPSKVGGKPAWLDLKHIPEANETSCSKCKVPLVFLCQLYAPIDEPDFHGTCFHRTLYVFYCNECSDQRTYAVFRSQLPKRNIYYSDEPAEPSDPNITPDMWGTKLCKVCARHEDYYQ